MNLNHILIKTNNLNEMTRFIEQVTELKTGPRPPFPFLGAWIYNDEKAIFHLVETHANQAQQEYLNSGSDDGCDNNESGVKTINYSNNSIDHIALEGSNYEELIARLKQHEIPYVEKTVPLSMTHQVFVQGPDGIKLEILFDSNKKQIH